MHSSQNSPMNLPEARTFRQPSLPKSSKAKDNASATVRADLNAQRVQDGTTVVTMGKHKSGQAAHNDYVSRKINELGVALRY